MKLLFRNLSNLLFDSQISKTDRQTDSFRLGHEPPPPRLYFKPAPPLRHPRHNDLLGLHRLIAGMEMYYASPAESRNRRARVRGTHLV